MKRILYIFVALLTFIACNDEDSETRFDTDLQASAFQFTPVMGGAVMRYSLSNDPDIVGLNIRYKDVYGKDLLRTASVTSDTMLIVGFNEAQRDVPAQVSLIRYDKSESKPIDVKFDTKDSAPITFINSASVASGWNGFSLSFENPPGATGMAHVFYLGTNPHTQEPDTILIKSFPLTEGKDAIVYTLEQKRPFNTVVVRADDYRGYIVKERVWENVETYETGYLDPNNFEVIYNNSVENEAGKLGLKYLTDGDTKGAVWFTSGDVNQYFTFLSKQDGAGENSEPMYIDLKKPRLTSEMRFYAYLSLGLNGLQQYRPNWGPNGVSSALTAYFTGRYPNKIPCAVTVYGCKENSDSRDWDAKEWVKIGSFSQEPKINYTDRWNRFASQCDDTYTRHISAESVNDADPIFKAINFAAEGQGEGFRYLKIKFDQVFGLQTFDNYVQANNEVLRYLSFHELEVYTKKD